MRMLELVRSVYPKAELITYITVANVIENGFSLKSFFVFVQVEAFLLSGGQRCHICTNCPGRLEGDVA